MRNVTVAAGIVIGLIALSVPRVPEAAAQSARCPVVGGGLVTGTNAEASNINPLLRVDSDGDYLSSWVFDRMVDVDPKTFSPIPWLAQSWTVSKDGTSYTFRLRRGVKWQDGQPFTARDVEFTLKTILAPGYTGPFRSQFSVIAGAKEFTAGTAKVLSGVKVVDDNTLQIQLSQALAPFLVTSMRELKPVPQHLVEGQDIARGDWAQHPVGTGPFKFVEWVKGDHWSFQFNPGYWNGRACLDTIRHQIVPDLNTELVAVQTGQVDTDITPPVTEIPRLQAEGKLEVIQMPPQGAESVQFNLRDPIVKDVRVREAIARGLDVATFTKDILKGVTQPADGVAMPTSWAYDPTVKMPSYDVEKAKQLLAEAGYSNGFTLNWSINSGNLFRQQFSTFAQAQLAKLNIKVNIMNPEWPVFLDSVMTGKYQVAHENTAGGLPDPDVWYYTFRTGGPGNVFGYSNPQVDTLLDQARTLTTQNDRKRIYVQVERILATDLPVFFAYFRPNPIVKNPKLKGLNPQPINPYFQIERWYKER